MTSPLDELALLLRPAGGGLYLVSTGRAEQLALQRRLYGAADEAGVTTAWRAALERIPTARAIVLGIPSDVGAGFRRGSNLGPQALRTACVAADAAFPDWMAQHGIIDVGDVFCVPQLLHDDMLSESQKAASRRALYPTLSQADAAKLPVSPLSIAERALDLILQLNPKVAPVLLGGDHACAWPAVAALSRVHKENWGIVQPDAHTDLLEERLGVKICFATWSFHANVLLGRGGKLVQVGTRASRYPRAHWEKTQDVRQFWAEEVLRDPEGELEALLAHLKRVGVTHVYFSNDIDGTDDSHADATGTPEPGGLDPEWLVELIRRLGAEFTLIGGDVMEVAPPLGPQGGERTVALGARYLKETLRAIVRAD